YSGDLAKLASLAGIGDRGYPLAGVGIGSTGDPDPRSPIPDPWLPWDTSRPLVTIVNPLSSKQDVMRPTLLPNLLDTMRANLKVQPETPVRIFEIGKVYLTPKETEIE